MQSPRPVWQLLQAILFVLAVSRLFLSACGELWLDEIWSLNLSALARYPWEILRITHDNNHVLNTLQLWLWGSNQVDIIYRLVPMLFALATLTVFCVFYRKRPFELSILLALFGGSFLYLMLSTEARGYSGCFFFAFLAYHLEFCTDRSRYLNARQIVHLLGLLSHSSYLCFLLALALSRVVCNKSDGHSWKKNFQNWISGYGLTSIAVFFWLLFFVGPMQIGGMPARPFSDVLIDLIGYSTGYFPPSILFLPVLLLCVVLICWGLLSRQLTSAKRVFYFTQLLIVPLLVVWVKGGELLAVRYFWYIPFFLMLLIVELIKSATLQKSPVPVVVPLMLTTCLLLGNLDLVNRFLDQGRGQYREAINYLIQQSPKGPIHLTSDHDFRNETVIRYHKRFLAGGRRIVYQSTSNIADRSFKGISWLISHASEGEHKLNLSSAEGFVTFELVHSSSPSYSGSQWYVYRKSKSATLQSGLKSTGQMTGPFWARLESGTSRSGLVKTPTDPWLCRIVREC